MIWIGVDAHKRVHQGVALGATGLVAQKQIANTATGWAELRTWAAAWPDHIWHIEGSASYGRGLAQFLAELGERVHEVSPKWTAERRRTMRKPGKSDRLDAHAVARLLREEAGTLPVVLPEDPDVATLQLWSRLRDELVVDMTRVRNKLHALLLLCDSEYQHRLPSLTTRAGVAACQHYTAPGLSVVAREREQAVRHLAMQLALLADQEREIQHKLECATSGRFSPLRTMSGIGALIAAGLIAELGAPRPGFGEAQLAALAGVSPLEASSAGGTRHRLNRLGNRRLNRLLHQIAMTQARTYAPAQTYLTRRQQEDRTAREARRAVKRQLVRSVWRRWQACWPAPSIAEFSFVA
jgi:transposase